MINYEKEVELLSEELCSLNSRREGKWMTVSGSFSHLFMKDLV